MLFFCQEYTVTLFVVKIKKYNIIWKKQVKDIFTKIEAI